jgi:hypothetical protein
MGIEPTLSAWEAEVLPLNYTRMVLDFSTSHSRHNRARLPSPSPTLFDVTWWASTGYTRPRWRARAVVPPTVA